MKVSKILVLMLFIGSIFASCNKSEMTPKDDSHSNTSGSFELLQKKVLTPTCASAGCHASINDASYKQHNLVLKGPDVYRSLINGSVSNKMANDAGLMQIVPKDVEKSFFFQKVNFAKSMHKYGNSMPLGSDPLTANQIKFINDWIAAGAPEKGHVADEELLLH